MNTQFAIRRYSISLPFLIVTGIIILMSYFSGCSSDDDDMAITPVPSPVQITSASEADATGGLPFVYRVTYAGEIDGPVDSIIFSDFPSWLTPDADSIFGTPPDGLSDTSFTVTAYERASADTLAVAVDMIPCILVYGDSRTGHTVHQTVVDSMMTRKPAAVFHTGDLVNDGLSSSDWTTFLDITYDMRHGTEFYPSLGNHERQSYLYFLLFELPGNEQWYSVELNNTHFIILNSCVAIDSLSEQYAWLENDLAGIHDSIRFTVAVFHHPPYSTGPHTEDEMGLREKIVPLFEQHGVDIVFNGHDHDYERSFCGGIYYIVAGGGGAPLRDQARTHPCSRLFIKTYHYCKLSILNERMVVRVYDLNHQLIDEFELPSD